MQVVEDVLNAIFLLKREMLQPVAVWKTLMRDDLTHVEDWFYNREMMFLKKDINCWYGRVMEDVMPNPGLVDC